MNENDKLKDKLKNTNELEWDIIKQIHEIFQGNNFDKEKFRDEFNRFKDAYNNLPRNVQKNFTESINSPVNNNKSKDKKIISKILNLESKTKSKPKKNNSFIIYNSQKCSKNKPKNNQSLNRFLKFLKFNKNKNAKIRPRSADNIKFSIINKLCKILKEFIFPTKTYLELKTQIIIIAIKSAKMVM